MSEYGATQNIVQIAMSIGERVYRLEEEINDLIAIANSEVRDILLAEEIEIGRCLTRMQLLASAVECLHPPRLRLVSGPRS